MTSPKTVKNRDRGRRGGESGRRTIYKLISIRKKSQDNGTIFTTEILGHLGIWLPAQLCRV